VRTATKEGQEIDKVLVWKRYPGKYTSETPMIMGRDFSVDEVLKPYRGQIVEPVSQDAEAPLFLMYTSGTTGKPKGCQHRTGGYLAYVTGTAKYYQDIHPEDVYSPRPASSTKASRNSPTPAVPGASPNASTSTFSTLPPPPSACFAKPAATSRRITTTTSST